MKRSVLVSTCIASLAVSGCYIVPIDMPPPSAGVNYSPTAFAGGLPNPPSPTVQQVRLYPLNETAGKTGMLAASVSDNARGHATFSVNYGGEILSGEAQRVPAGYPGFGRVLRDVYGDGKMPAGQRGVAAATGGNGTYVNCEYALTAANRGTGACLFSNGAKYQLHFGS